MLAQNCAAALLALYTRKLSKKYPGAHYQALAVMMSVVYLFGLSFVVFSAEILHVGVFRDYLWLYLLTGLGFVLSYSLTHQVFEHVDTAVGSLYSTFNIIGVVIASSLIIREKLTWHQFAGAILLLIAMAVMLSVHTTHKRHGRWLHALLLSMGAAVSFGLSVTGEKFLLDRTNLQTYILFGWGSQWLWVMVFSLLFHRHKFVLIGHEKFIHTALWAGALRAIGGFLFIVALVQSNNSSLVAVWSGLRIFLAAAFAALLLHERQFLTRKLEASLLAIAAVALLVW